MFRHFTPRPRRSSLFGRWPEPLAVQRSRPQEEAPKKPDSPPRCVNCNAWLVAIVLFVVVVGTGVAVSVFYLHLLDFNTSQSPQKPQHHRYPWPPTEASTNELRRAGNDTLHVEPDNSNAVTATSVTSTHGEVNSQGTAVTVADSDKVASKRRDV
ncbi:hypothetical protein MTO96_017369 [Rhipicephalus appendiculatus]